MGGTDEGGADTIERSVRMTEGGELKVLRDELIVLRERDDSADGG